MIRMTVRAFLVSLLFAGVAVASDECTSACPEGEVQVSFADGNNAQCVCAPAGEGMVETVVSEINCSDPEDDGSCE